MPVVTNIFISIMILADETKRYDVSLNVHIKNLDDEIDNFMKPEKTGLPSHSRCDRFFLGQAHLFVSWIMPQMMRV